MGRATLFRLYHLFNLVSSLLILFRLIFISSSSHSISSHLIFGAPRRMTARSLKRPMLHTCSGVVSGCEFKGFASCRRPQQDEELDGVSSIGNVANSLKNHSKTIQESSQIHPRIKIRSGIHPKSMKMYPSAVLGRRSLQDAPPLPIVSVRAQARAHLVSHFCHCRKISNN